MCFICYNVIRDKRRRIEYANRSNYYSKSNELVKIPYRYKSN